jgi:predicted nucleic acid-binding protein
VLASAVDARAELLVTGDADLLAVAEEAPVEILNPRAFWERMSRR